MIQLKEKQKTKLSTHSSSPATSSFGSNGGGGNGGSFIGAVMLVAVLSSCITGLFAGGQPATSFPADPAPVINVAVPVDSSPAAGAVSRAPGASGAPGSVSEAATTLSEAKASVCKMRIPDSVTQEGDTPELAGSKLLLYSQTVEDTDAAQRKFVEAFHIYTKDQNPEGRGWALEGILCASTRQWTIEFAANAALLSSYQQGQTFGSATPSPTQLATEQPSPTQHATAQSTPTPTMPSQAAVELTQACTTLIREFEMVRVLAKSEGLTARVSNLEVIPSKSSFCTHPAAFKLQQDAVIHRCPVILRTGDDEIFVNLTLKLDPEMHAEFALVHLGGSMTPLFVYAKQTLMQTHTYLSRASARLAANYDIETEAYTIRRMQPFEVDVIEGESPKNVSIALSDPASLIVAECEAGDSAATVGRVCKKLNAYSQTTAPSQP